MSQELGSLDALQSFLEELPEKLEKSPYDYTIYSQWISLLRAIDDMESMRVAREHMYRAIAVPEDIWAEWIRDELERPGALNDSTTIKHVANLYTLAAKEYALLSTWQGYISFLSDLSTSLDDKTRVAAAEAFGSADYVLPILQSAVDATEAHYKDSQAIWIQYKEYIERAIHSAASPDGANAEASVLIDLLQEVFVERLGRPHAELEATFALYSQFITQHRNDAYEQHMVDANRTVSQTRQLCAIRDACEDDLAKSAGSWEATMSYIERLTREKATDTKEVCMLYERGLSTSRYSPAAWDEYISFLAGSVGEMQASLSVASRAVRNCPWSGNLWAQLMHLTYAESGLHAANEVYARAVSTHAVEYSMAEFSQLAAAHITIARLHHQSDPAADTHTLLQTCKDSLDAAYALDISTADSTLKLERCCTAVVADVLLDATAARKMWTRICKARRVCTEAWVLSAEFEQAHGSEANARSVYRHASQRRLDNPERLFDVWTTFEHNCGSLSDIYSAGHTINLQRRLIQRRAEREAHAALSSVVSDSVEAEPGNKRQRVSGQGHASEPEMRNVPITDPKSMNKAIASDKRVAQGGNVVFASNLPPSFGPQDVENLLGGRSSVSKVTMLETKHDATPRGQARVELSTIDALIAALDKNGLKINGHFVSIHTFKPSRQSRDASKTATIEVRGFSPETGNKKIEQVARQVGVPVRVHRSRLGDVVYVVMKLQDAQQAADALNGCSVDDRKLEACIAEADEEVPEPSHAPAVTETMPAAPDMIPRKAAARRPTKKVALTSASSSTPQTSSTEKVHQITEAKSNADFRQLLLDQKRPDEGANGA
ncbi:Splicing factor [Coemansia aciculifera]|uniref:Splicing factor n=1 Tax=Coemansia aciculifera TaxID=417176 RepID=A0A9W8ISN0_9FUNG|nr:Splicing factor [Coemansia aciculifera]